MASRRFHATLTSLSSYIEALFRIPILSAFELVLDRSYTRV